MEVRDLEHMSDIFSAAKQSLQAHYVRELKLQYLFYDLEPIPIDQAPQLVLVKEEEQKEKERRALGDREEAGVADTDKKTEWRDERLASFEDLHKPKEPVDLKKLFTTEIKDKHSQPAKRFLIVGRAGIGKTVLCKFITTKNYELWRDQFEWVFYIPLRNLKESYGKRNKRDEFKIDLAKVISCERFPDDERVTEVHIQQMLRSGKVLLVLDGYDELSSTIPESALTELLSYQYIVLTSRPYSLPDWRTYDYVQLENMGFSNEAINEYAQKFFTAVGHSDYSKSFLQFLRQNSAAWGIAHIPLNLELICSLWEEKRTAYQEIATPFTLTSLYQDIVLKLFKRYLTKREVNPIAVRDLQVWSEDQVHQETAHITLFLEELALRAIQLLHGNILINSEAMIKPLIEEFSAIYPHVCQIRDRHLFKEVLAAQLLKGTGSQLSLVDQDYYFTHLTFQEFFAASLIARKLKEVGTLCSEKHEHIHQLILMHRYNPRFQLVWRYVAGLLKREIKPLRRFFHILRTEPRDLLCAYERQLLVHCLAECEEPAELHLKRDALLEPLLVMLRDKNYGIKPAVLRLKRDPLVGPLLVMLRDEKGIARDAAAGALGNIGAAIITPVVLEALLGALRDKDGSVRSAVARALGKLDAVAVTPTVMETLLVMLRDEEQDVRSTAARALRNMDVAVLTPAVLETLLVTLRDEKRDVRSAAAQILGNVGVAAATPAVLEALSVALRDEKWGVRYAAANALGNMGAVAATPAVLEALLVALRNKNNNVRDAAAAALANMGAAAARPAVLEAMLEMLRDENQNVRFAAVQILRDMGAAAAKPAVLEAMLEMLRDENQNVRFAAVQILRDMSAAVARPVVLEALLEMLRDKNSSVRSAAVQALGNMSAAAARPVVLEALLEMLRDKNSSVRSAAVQALGNMSAAAARPVVLEALLEMLRDKDSSVRSAAARVLGDLGAAVVTPAVLDALFVALRDKDVNVISAAADALANMDAAAATPAVLEALLEMVQEKKWVIRYNVANALENIGNAVDLNTLLPQNHVGAEILYTAIATALTFHFTKQHTALFYEPDQHAVCYWKKGVLQRIVLPPASRHFLICEIQKAWIEHTHLPISVTLPRALTPLHEAAAKGDLPQLHSLLIQSSIELDNQHNLQAFTPLMCAVRAGQVEATEMLLNADATVHYVSSCERERPSPTDALAGTQLQTAVTLAAQHPDTHTRHHLLNLFLARRQQVSLDEFESWLASLAEMHEMNEIAEPTQALLNRKIGQWTAMGDLTPFFCEHAVRYQTHQTNMLLAIVESSKITKSRREVTATFKTQDRFDPKVFLSMRIALLMELLVRVVHSSSSFDMPVGENKYKLLVWLKSECLLMFETLYTFQESELINELYEKRRDKKKCRTLLQVIAQNIARKLATLQPGEHYEFMSGFIGHTAYVLITRQGDQWIAQLDNLDDEAKHPHHLRDSTDPNKLYPYYLGAWSQPELQTPACTDLLTDLLQAAFLPKAEALSLLYPRIEQTLACVHQWLSLPAQHIDNCVAHNHNAGLYYRLLQRCEGSQETTQKLYEWLIDRELELLAPWLRQQAHEALPLAPDARRAAQNYRGSVIPEKTTLEDTSTARDISLDGAVSAASSFLAPTARFLPPPAAARDGAQFQTESYRLREKTDERNAKLDAEQERIQLNYALGLSRMQEKAAVGSTVSIEELPDEGETEVNDSDTEVSSSASGYSSS